MTPLDRIAALVSERAGLAHPAARRHQLDRGVRRWLVARGLSGPEDALALVASTPSALDDLVEHLVVPETYFFRDAGQLAFVAEEVLPALRDSGRPPVVWSAACSTGAEPYTLAILLAEQGLLQGAHVLGTDISERALATARYARYGPWALRGMSDGRRATWLERDADRFRVVAPIRRAVRFSRANLVGDAPLPGRCDLVLCRNVLIYFTPDAVASAARRLFDALTPGGWLVTGASDPPLSRYAPFEVHTDRRGLFYRRPDRLRRPAPPREAASPPPLRTPPKGTPRPTATALPPRAAPPAPEPAAVTATAPSPSPGPTALDALCARARALADAGRPQRALAACASAAARHPDAAAPSYVKALVLSALGRDDDALDALRRATFLDPGLIVAHVLRGAVLARRGDADAAASAWRTARALCDALPDDAPVPLTDDERVGTLATALDARLGLDRTSDGDADVA